MISSKLYRLFTYTVTTAGGFQLPSVKLSCIQCDSAVKKDHEGLVRVFHSCHVDLQLS